MQRKPPAYAGPRYRVQLRNGVYQVFDAVYYGVVDAKPSEKAAQARADELNARPAPQRRRHA